ncbi:MAG: hypothetical protein ACI9R8_002797, partial [Candidatus Paceibacteria bacterium]
MTTTTPVQPVAKSVIENVDQKDWDNPMGTDGF